MPRIALTAERDTAIAGMEILGLTLTRDAPLDGRLTVTVRFTQDRDWLSNTSPEVTFAAGEASAELSVVATDFSQLVTESGSLTATVDTVSGYDTGDATATVYVVSQEGPAMKLSFSAEAYEFAEDAEDPSVTLVAQAASGMPRGVGFRFTMVPEERTAGSPDDYDGRVRVVLFRERDFTVESGLWTARVRPSLPLVDDDVREGSETFSLFLGRSGSETPDLQVSDPMGSPCPAGCPTPVSITDDEDIPEWEFSVSSDEIREEDEGSAAANVSITNGKTFAADQVVSFGFAGTATKDTDYRVAPTDLDGETPGHQATLSAASTSAGVTLTAVDDDIEDSNEEIEISATHDGEAIGSPQTIRILNQEIMPAITLAASRDTIIAGLEGVMLSATREAPLDSPLAVTLQVAQEQDWLSRTSFRLNFAAGGSRATLNLARALFSSEVTQSGSFTATIDSVSGHETGDASATVHVVSQAGPAIEVSFADSSYRFTEDQEDPVVAFIVRAAEGMPRGSEFEFSVSSRAGIATSPGDYGVVGAVVAVSEEDFALGGGVWQARSEVSLTLVDDDVFEGTESFDLLLEMTPGLSAEIQLSDVEGAPCQNGCRAPVEILDDEDTPVFTLSVSDDEIREEGETSSAVTVAITNGKTFAGDQALTFGLGGGAIAGSDYDVTPADADEGRADHQAILQAGSSSTALTFMARDDEREEGDEEIRISASHDGAAVGSGTIRLVDRFPGPRVEITFEGVQPPRDEYAAGVATGPFLTRFTFSEPVQGFEEEDIRWSTHSLTTVDTTNIAVLVWDYTVVRAGLEYTARMMPDQNGRLWIDVLPGAARSVATGDGNQLGANSLWVDLPERRVMVEPRTLTVDEGDADGAQFLVLLTSAPTGPVTVMVTGTDGTVLEVDRPTFTFDLPYWNGGWVVTVTAGDDANTADERLGLWVKASGGGYDGHSADLRINVRDDDGSASADAEEEDPLSLLRGVTAELAAAALFGEAGLKQAQIGALDRLGNRNGRYDLGDVLALVARRREGRSNRPRRRRSRTRTRGRRRGGVACRRPRRVRLALAMLAVVALTSACDHGAGLLEPPTEELGLDAGFMKVELRAPAGARDVGAWLAVEGPDIGSLRAPGFEVFESDTQAGKQIILAGALSEGSILEFQIPDRRFASKYRVRLIEVTGEDYAPRDISAYTVSITR